MNTPTDNSIKISPGFWAALRQIGISASDIARVAGLPPKAIHEPAVTAARYLAIWQSYSELMGDTAAAVVKLATGFETAQYPPSALSTYHAGDYREALSRMVRYKPMCPPENLRMDERGDTCVLSLEWLHGERPGPPVLIGVTLAYLLELGRRGTGRPLAARSVEFAQPMGDVRTLESYFGCPVRIGANGNRLTLRRSDLDRPFVSHNAELLDMLTPALDRSLDELRRSRSVSDNVKRRLIRGLAGGPPDMQAIAGAMGMSDRTLQRRLSAEGASFKRLLAQARHEQTLAYLADPALDIAEIAYLVGYEDQNSFYRAFRQWEGDTPANWRVKQEGWRERPVTEPSGTVNIVPI